MAAAVRSAYHSTPPVTSGDGRRRRLLLVGFLSPSLSSGRGCVVNTEISTQIGRSTSQFECGFSRSCDDSENEPIRLVFLRSGDNHRWQQIMTATTALGVVLLRASSVVELPLLCFEVEKQFHNEMKSQRYLYARLLVSCKG